MRTMTTVFYTSALKFQRYALKIYNTGIIIIDFARSEDDPLTPAPKSLDHVASTTINKNDFNRATRYLLSLLVVSIED